MSTPEKVCVKRQADSSPRRKSWSSHATSQMRRQLCCLFASAPKERRGCTHTHKHLHIRISPLLQRPYYRQSTKRFLSVITHKHKVVISLLMRVWVENSLAAMFVKAVGTKNDRLNSDPCGRFGISGIRSVLLFRWRQMIRHVWLYRLSQVRMHEYDSRSKAKHSRS